MARARAAPPLARFYGPARLSLNPSFLRLTKPPPPLADGCPLTAPTPRAADACSRSRTTTPERHRTPPISHEPSLPPRCRPSTAATSRATFRRENSNAPLLAFQGSRERFEAKKTAFIGVCNLLFFIQKKRSTPPKTIREGITSIPRNTVKRNTWLCEHRQI